ncbi:MAG TPA: SCO family protein, partial [Lysobacter sp.]|nr:SCO family protein [Lysobacter sp.]
MKWLIRSVAFAVAALLCASALAAPKPAAPLPGDSVYQLPLQLTDQHGRKADWRTRRGKPQLVAMFYTSCQYICPLIVDSGKAIERQLTPAQQQRLGILLISMDPARDDPAALKAVADQRRLDLQRWTLAAPPANDVRAVAGVLGVRYRALADGEFNHTSALVLLDA